MTSEITEALQSLSQKDLTPTENFAAQLFLIFWAGERERLATGAATPLADMCADDVVSLALKNVNGGVI